MDQVDQANEENDGSDDEEGRPRSKAEIMAEVMLKSKQAKHDRQQVKEADDDVRRELDEGLDDIRGLLFQTPSLLNGKPADADAKGGEKETMQPLVKSRKRILEEEMERRAKEREQDVKLGTVSSAPAAETKKAEEEAATIKTPSYDAAVREMAMERRSKPSDRLKTDAELAAEAARKLQENERKRLKRMRGDDEDEHEDEGGGKKRKGRAAPGADDLDDDFELDGVTAGEAYGLGQGLGGKAADEDDQDDEEDEDSEGSEGGVIIDDDEDAIMDNEASDEEDDEHNYNDLADLDRLVNEGEDLDSDEEEVAEEDEEALIEKKGTIKKRSKSKSKAKEAESSLPFTFPCPATHAEFMELLEDHNVPTKDVPTVIKRARTLYHASLGEDNKNKLQALLRVLVDHHLYTASKAQSMQATASKTPESISEIKTELSLLNSLVKPIYELSQTYTLTASQIFVGKLAVMQRNLTRGISAAGTASGSAAKTWPGFAELSFFRLTAIVWPTSDRQHLVTTPYLLLLAQYLAHARVRVDSQSALSDIASGMYLASLVASAEKESKRLFPEALNFLFQALALLAPLDKAGREHAQQIAATFGIPLLSNTTNSKAALALQCDVAQPRSTATEERISLLDMLSARDPKDALGRRTRTELYAMSCSLIEEFTRLYRGSDSFVELFTPFVELLRSTNSKAKFGDAVQLESSLSRQVTFAQQSRRSLRLQAHRALSIASYVPKFEQSGYDARQRFDPDTERAQESKLKALLKKERKGAIRELRRDAQFVANVRDQERRNEDQSYKRKIDKITQDLRMEQSEQKQLDKEKARLKKRR